MIDNSTLKVYAKSLFEVACDIKKEEIINEQIDEFKNQVLNNNEFYSIITSNFYTKNLRRRIIDNCFANSFQEELVNFINILVKNDLISNYKKIFTYYKQYLEDKKGIKFARVYSKFILDNSIIEKISKKLKDKYKYREVKIENIIDENIISGIRIKIDSITIDGTVNTQLQELKNKIMERAN
jgi:F-type H+-transporting ATPase subunit delta